MLFDKQAGSCVSGLLSIYAYSITQVAGKQGKANEQVSNQAFIVTGRLMWWLS